MVCLILKKPGPQGRVKNKSHGILISKAGMLDFGHCNLFEVCYLRLNLVHLRQTALSWCETKAESFGPDALLVG